MLDDLKLYLAVEGGEADELLTMLLDQSEAKVLAHTRQGRLPEDARGLVVEMAADAYRLMQQSRGDAPTAVESASDNGQSVHYRPDDYAQVTDAVSRAFLKNYCAVLARYCKVGW